MMGQSRWAEPGRSDNDEDADQREIELLAPTVDSLRRPDNCEYPWEDGAGVVVVPTEYPFATLSLLSEAAGQELLRIIPFAVDELL